LYSQLSFISLPSFEMLSDCVISRLYMRVLKLTREKLISVNFPQFSDVSERSVRTFTLVIRTGSGYVSMRAATNGRTVRILIRTRATCLHGFEAARVQTALIHRSDGDPTGPINSWSPHILSTPPKSFLLESCELFLASF
jgi:hypothetical protein